LEETFINDPGRVAQGRFLRENTIAEVPPNQYVVMGDNRLHSSDSREWGFVNRAGIVGRAFFRYWPMSTLGVLKTAEEELSMESVQGVVNGTSR
jgi:signal peptidase I